jgi:tRNA pseudouridine55 synthase
MMEKTPSILLIDKPASITSFTALSAVKRVYGKRVGHAGTLDKFASGLLVVLTSSMTRLNQIFTDLDKEYRAWIRFGEETDTLDPEGAVVATAPIPTREQIEAVIDSFIGPIIQVPPVYSALHIDGRRASDLVRSGKEVTMEGRAVTVHSLTLISYEEGTLIADIHVSKGTYIRSLARDIGRACSSRAHLVDLVRTSVGPYRLEEAIDASDEEALRTAFTHTDSRLLRLSGMGRMESSDTELWRVANGSFPNEYTIDDPLCRWAALYGRQSDTLRAVLDMERRKVLAQINGYRRRVQDATP